MHSEATVTTAVNPGAFNPPPKQTIRRLVSGTMKRLKQGELMGSVNYFISSAFNYLDQRKSRNKFSCNVCNKPSPYFYHNANKLRIKWNSICPHCNSRPRHRGLYELYKSLSEGVSILHFAPEPVFYNLLKRKTEKYYTTDYILTDVDYPKEDIQSLSLESSQFDVVLCNHVIEHVPEDEKALSEMNRILKPGGKAIITIPGDFRRKKTIYFKDLKLNGHYRDYGSDFTEKAEKYFSKVEAVDLSQYDNQALSLAIPSSQDVAFICHK